VIFFPGHAYLPISSAILAAFIAHLFEKGYAPSTIATYIAGISNAHHLNGHADPAAAFVIRRLIIGTRKAKPSSDSRLPITLHILHRLVSAVNSTTSNRFNRSLLRAMLLLAFHAFLRVGEITHSPHTLQLDDISFETTHGVISGLIIDMKHFKHSSSKHRAKLYVASTQSQLTCPVKAVLAFLHLRGLHQGPLFSFGPNLSVSRYFFCKALANNLTSIGLDPQLYKAHSLRIGAATTAQSLGHSESDIKHMGRWRSNAFTRYIRIPMLALQ